MDYKDYMFPAQPVSFWDELGKPQLWDVLRTLFIFFLAFYLIGDKKAAFIITVAAAVAKIIIDFAKEEKIDFFAAFLLLIIVAFILFAIALVIDLVSSYNLATITFFLAIILAFLIMIAEILSNIGLAEELDIRERLIWLSFGGKLVAILLPILLV